MKNNPEKVVKFRQIIPSPAAGGAPLELVQSIDEEVKWYVPEWGTIKGKKPNGVQKLAEGAPFKGYKLFNPDKTQAIEVINVYTPLATYFIPEGYGAARNRKRLHTIWGFFLDFDASEAHNEATKSLSEIEEVLSLLEGIPFTDIVKTGGGFHVRFLFPELLIKRGAGRNEELKDLQSKLESLAKAFEAHTGLKADKGALKIDQLTRQIGSYNTKQLTSMGDRSKVHKVEIIKRSEGSKEDIWSFICESQLRYSSSPDKPKKAEEKEAEGIIDNDAYLKYDTSPEEVSKILSFLDYTAFSEYHSWLKVGLALHHWDSHTGNKGVGLKLWDNWSKPFDSYNSEELEAKWESFSKDGNGSSVTIGSLIYLAKKAGYHTSPKPSPALTINAGRNKLEVCLPNGAISYTDFIENTCEALNNEGSFYYQNGRIKRITEKADDLNIVSFDSKVAFQSSIEIAANIFKIDGNGDKQPALVNQNQAEIILKGEDTKKALRNVVMISRAPIYTIDKGKMIVRSGYDSVTEIYSHSPEVDKNISLTEAKELLDILWKDTGFSTENDKSRAYAAILTPAIIYGQLLDGARAPFVFVQADGSQAGKGYTCNLISTMYRENTTVIAQTTKGVGSLDNAFDAAIGAGEGFIQLDNLRGEIDSPKIESFATERTYMTRSAFVPEVRVDTSRYFVMATSNGVDVTDDLGNRINPINIRGQEDGYRYQNFTIDGRSVRVHKYLEANLAKFQGAIFTILKEWVEVHNRAEKPTDITNAFERYWNSVEFICTEILNLPSPSEGVKRSIEVSSDKFSNYLRLLCIATEREGRLGESFKTTTLLRLGYEADVSHKSWYAKDVDFDDGEDDYNPQLNSLRAAFGRRMGKAFKEEDVIEICGYQIHREQSQSITDSTKTDKSYTIILKGSELPSKSDADDVPF